MCMCLCVWMFMIVCINVCVIRPPKMNIDVLIRCLCCLKPFAPRGVLTNTDTDTDTNSHTHSHTQTMACDNCVIFSMRTVADNRHCFSSYCDIVLSDRRSVRLQSTPATRPFTGMLIWAQKYNTIIEHNSLMADLLAFYMCFCIFRMMTYPRYIFLRRFNVNWQHMKKTCQ